MTTGTITGTVITTGYTLNTKFTTITSTGTVHSVGGYAVYGSSASSLTVNNAGYISAYNGGLLLEGAAGTVVNSHVIRGVGQSYDGVLLVNGGVVSNNSGGTIEGASYAIQIKVGQGAVFNAGDLLSSMGGDVYLEAGGSVTNASGGTLQALQFGIRIRGAAGTVFNAGSVSGTNNGGGIVLYNGGYVSNASTGRIAASKSGSPHPGIYIEGGAGTVVNAGYIANYLTAGVYLKDGGTVTNAGKIVGANGTAVKFASGHTNRMVLDPGANFFGTVNGGNTISAASTSTLELATAAGAGAGMLSGLGSKYINFAQVTIDSGATWTLSGSNSGFATLVDGGTLINAGLITGASYGVVLANGAVLTNQSAGTIIGSVDGVSANSPGTVVNAGSIAGGTSPGIGVYLGGGGTLTNLSGGKISGGADAVKFGVGHTNRLVIAPSASFTGTVNGGNTIGAASISTLELTTGASAGTLTGLGSTFVNFAQVTIDGGASWTLGGTLSGFATLSDAGTLQSGVTLGSGSFTVSNASTGRILNTSASGTALYAAGALHVVNAGSIGGGGGTGIGVYLAGGGTLTNLGGDKISGGADAVKFGASHTNRLVIAPSASFTGTVDGGNSIGAASISMLELTTGASAGMLISLGSKYLHFANITVDGSAAWTLASGSIGSGYTINDAGTLTNAATLGSTVTLGSGAVLTNALGGVISVSGAAVYGAGTSGAATVVNAGSIVGAGTYSYGIQFGTTASGGAVSNQLGGVISGAVDGIDFRSGSGAGAVQNYGTITGGVTSFTGIYLEGGGSVTNASGGEITAFFAGVVIANGTAGIVNNAGSIGASFVGVWLKRGGTVTNASGGTITGGYSTYDAGVYLQAGGSVTNQSSATIGGLRGVYAKTVSATVMNAGNIVGSGTTVSGGPSEPYGGVYLGAGGLVSNQSGGTITGYYGVYAKNSAATVVNAGVIAGNYTSSAQHADGVYLRAGGTVTNQSTGTIFGRNDGVLISGARGTVLNLGSIHSHGTVGGDYGSYGVELTDGGVVINGTAGGTAAYIVGYHNGVRFDSAASTTDTLINYGTISGKPGGVAVVMYAGVVINGQSGATGALIRGGDQNSGVLISGAATVINYATITSYTPLFTNALGFGVSLAGGGTISNLGSSALIEAYLPVYAAQGATVINSGTIKSQYGGGTGAYAVLFGGGTNRLIIDPGAKFYGTVRGSSPNPITLASGNSGASVVVATAAGTATLELASGTSAGTISGIGVQYVGFSAVTIDSGARWVLSGSNSIASDVTLTNSGTDTVTGTLVNDGVVTGSTSGVVLAAGGLISNQTGGIISATASSGVAISASGAGTVVNAGSIVGAATGSGAAGVLLAAGGTLNNLSGGAISGIDGVVALGTTAAVSNAGMIAGKIGVYFESAGGAVINQSGGTISGTTVTGSGGFGVRLLATGSVTNQSGGVITGTVFGVVADYATATIVNAGSIAGAYGVDLTAGGMITNQSGGTINGGTAAVKFGAGHTNRLVDDPGAVFVGTVDGGNTIGAASISTLELASSASAGTLAGLGSTIVNFAYVTIDSGATWTLNGTSSGFATLSNAGKLQSGVVLGSGSFTVSNVSGGTISNTSTSGTALSATGTLAVVNAGSIGGGTSTGIGVYLSGGGTLTNQAGGAISGGADAVKFGASHTNRLVIAPSASFTGTVDGGNTIGAASVSTLELASTGSTGTLSGLGTQFIDFAQVTIDSGAKWTLSGTNSLVSGATLTNNSTLTVGGTFTNAGQISGTSNGVILTTGALLTNLSGGTIIGSADGVTASGSATITDAGSIGGTTASGIGVYLSAGGTLTNQAGGAISGGTDAVKFGASHTNRLVIVPSASFVGTVDGGNTIGAVSISTLELASGASTGTLTSLGSKYIHFANITIDGSAAWALASGSIGSGYTINDAGTLTNDATLGSAVTLGSDAQLTNASGGMITTTGAAVYRTGTSGVATVVNAGSIAGLGIHGYGIRFNPTSSGGTVTNQSGGVITGGEDAIYFKEGSGAGTVSNYGMIASGSTGLDGIRLFDGGSVSNAAHGTITGYAAGVWFGFGTGTVSNAGSIGGTALYGVFLGNAGSVTNASGGTITGGIVIDGNAAVVNDAGYIGGGQNSGIYLAAGGTISVGSTGTIGAISGDILVSNGAGTITNNGTLLSTFGYGINLGAGGSIDNTGEITASSGPAVRMQDGGYLANGGMLTGTIGVVANGTAALTIVDTGSIIGSSGTAIAFGTANDLLRLQVSTSAFIQGTVNGGAGTSTLEFSSATGAGTLTGSNADFVNFAQGTVDSGAQWLLAGTNTFGSSVTLSESGTLTDSGTLTNAGLITSASYGVVLANGAMLSNHSGGTIIGSVDGISASSAGTVVNTGRIAGGTGSGGYGIVLSGGGEVINGASGGTVSAAYIGGYQSGVQFGGTASSTLINYGTVSGGGGSPGVMLTNGVVINGRSGATGAQIILSGGFGNKAVAISGTGTVINYGTIDDPFGSGPHYYGIFLYGTGTVSNLGTASLINGYDGGVYGGDDDTVTNAGTIANSNGSIAVKFAAGTNLLIVDPGARFVGQVTAAGTSTLELASGASAGTLSGLASQYVDFAQVTIDSGAKWTLSGTNTLVSGATLTDSGTLVDAGAFTNAGLILVDPPITVSGTFINSSIVSASGTYTAIYIDAGGVVTNSSGATISAGGYAITAPGTASVTNAGLITGGSNGIVLAAGAVSNQSGGTITGHFIGVDITSASGSVINSGVIRNLATYNASNSFANYAGVDLRKGGSVSNTTGATISAAGASFGVAVAGAAGTIRNAGTIDGFVTGVLLGLGGYISNASGGLISAHGHGIISLGTTTITKITNSSGGTITGNAGIYITLGATGIVINQGVISGNAFNAMYLTTGGTVSNASGGTISGTAIAIQMAGKLGTVINQGLITAAFSEGIYFSAGGTVTNSSGGTIHGATFGVKIAHGAATVVNAGSIGGSSGAVTFAEGYSNLLVDDTTARFGGTVDGGNSIGASFVSTLELASAGSTGTLSGLGTQFVNFAQVTIDSGATWTLSGTINGFSTLTNAGTVASGITLGSGTLTVSNQSSGAITGYYGVSASAAATVSNAGNIAGSGSYAAGVRLQGGGFVSNQSGGMISGANAVIAGAGGLTVVNAGSLAGSQVAYSGDAGVALDDGGVLTNQSSGVITGDYAVNGVTAPATIINAGTISGIDGAVLNAPALVTNQSGGTISGSYLGVQVLNHTGTVVNAGFIAGTANNGVQLSNGGTVTNQSGGTISGGVDAVKFDAGSTGLLVDDPDATFIGTVDGGNTIGAASISTLELASAASAGTLSGLGSKYINFAQVTIDSGASWTLSGTNTGFATLVDSGTLTNAGLITSTTYAVILTNGAVLTNQSGGTIIGTIDGVSASAAATVVNAGSIGSDASYGIGVLLLDGGWVSNELDGTITGAVGVKAGGASATVLNDGYIGGSTIIANGAGVILDRGGAVTNQANGAIVGLDGITAAAAATVVNAGSISGNTGIGEGVALGDGGFVTNQASAVITGYRGIAAAAAATVVNAGSIDGYIGNGFGVSLADGGSVTNQSSASVSGHNGIYAGTNAATVVNDGSIAGNGSNGIAVRLVAGGIVSDQSGGVITAFEGVYGGTIATTVVNDGSISGNTGNGFAVQLYGGGIFSNQSAGVITAFQGVRGGTIATTVVNYGRIFGSQAYSTGAGIHLLNGGSVTNSSGAIIAGLSGVYVMSAPATVVNDGTITGTTSFSAGAGVALLDGGAITNQSTASIYGYYGVSASGGATTLVNAGRIGAYGIYAVKFGAGAANRLVIDPGASFGGFVNGGNTLGATQASTLELASGGSAGTLTRLGTQYFNFAQVTIDSGAQWTLGGRNTLFSGMTMTDAGTLINTGTLIVDPPITVSGTFINTSIVSAPGTYTAIYVAAGGVVSNSTGATISAGNYAITAGGAASITNFGLITGAIGIDANANAVLTVVDAGSIVGSSGTAIAFGTANDLLQFQASTSAFIQGTVNGGGGTNTLEFASGASAGTLTGSGAYFVNFSQGTVDSGARWLLAGNVTFGSGVTFAEFGTFSDAGTLINAGLITSASTGMLVATGAMLTNQASATIIGSTYGVLTSGSATVVSGGSIRGGASSGGGGVRLGSSSSLTNQSGGSIYGYRGIVASAGVTVVNDGSISGNSASYSGDGTLFLAGGAGIDLIQGGFVTNQSTGVIGGYYGIFAKHGTLTVMNAGTIDGRLDGINVASGGTITNQSHGVIGVSGTFGVADFSQTRVTLANDGSIAGLYCGVFLGGGGYLTNQSGGSISGGVVAVLMGSRGPQQTTLINDGNIEGSTLGLFGAYLSGTNNWASNQSNGTISGYNGLGAAFGTLVNNGLVIGDSTAGHANGIVIASNGLVSNQSHGTISGYHGAAAYGYSAVVNAGSIGGATTGLGTGVLLSGGGTFVNQAGGTVSGAYAVRIGRNASFSRVVDYPNAVFIGTVLGGTTASTLELASAAQIGTLSGLGTQFTAFSQILVDPGAEWTLTGTATLGSGSYMNVYGTLAGNTTLASGVAEDVVLHPNALSVGTLDGGNTIGATAISALLLASGTSAGTLTGFGSHYVDFAQVTVATGATWTMASAGTATAGATITDYGALTNVTSLATAVYVESGAQLTNVGTASIVNAHTAAAVTDVGTVINTGLIEDTATTASPGVALAGVYLLGTSALTNSTGGTIQGYNAVTGQIGSVSTIVNAGSLIATGTGGYGIVLQATGNVSNSGLISAAGTLATGIVIKSGGTVDNAVGGTITGGSFGVQINGGPATIINAGTIGGLFAAVLASGYTDRVVFDPGAAFTGLVNGGNAPGASQTSTLELASGSSNGTLSYLGSKYTDFGQVTIDSGASWTLSGYGALVANATLTNAGTLTDGSTLLNAGTITSSLGTSGTALSFFGSSARLIEEPTAALIGTVSGGTGTMELASGSSAGSIAGFGSGIVNFASLVFDTNSRWTIAGNDSANGLGGLAIGGFTHGETIDLTGFLATTRTFSSNTLVLGDGAGDYSTLNIQGSFVTSQFDITPDNNGGTNITLCFCAGTRIATPHGEVPVEQLRDGDLVLTTSGQVRPIVWIGHGRVLATRGRRNEATPVIVRKGALSDNVPHRDLRVTKGHSFFIDDVLIPVEFLVNHRSILWDDRAQEVSIYHVELARHDVLLADGAPAESYRDDGNRWLFRNANTGWDKQPQEPCAPILTGGAIVDAIWRRLLDRAGPRPGLPLTDEADLHLIADGRRIDPTYAPGGWCVFRLPHKPHEVRVASRAVVPQECGLARDPRCLGVAVRQIMLSQGVRMAVIDADDTRLTEGFHSFEEQDGIRWTDGDAMLPATLFDSFNGPMTLELRLGGATRYPLLDRSAEAA